MRSKSKAIAGIALIMLASIMAGTTAVGATSEGPLSADDCPICPDSGMEFSSSFRAWALVCEYRDSVDINNCGNIAIWPYDNAGDAQKRFEDMRTYKKELKDYDILREDDDEIVVIKNQYSVSGVFLDICSEKNYITEVRVNTATKDKIIAIRRFDALAECAKRVVDKKCGEKEEKYFIYDPFNEIAVGEKIEFSIITENGEKVGKEKKDGFSWYVVGSKSISSYIIKDIIIGEIDKREGVFTGLNVGTCKVVLKFEDERVDKVEVKVKCPENVNGDLSRILSLYRSRIPEGPILEDVKSGKTSICWGKQPAFSTNLLSHFYNKRYKPFTCGGYQKQVLIFLEAIQANSKECALLNGYKFRPIQGLLGWHQAVVIYPEDTDWKKTGIVLDPWLTQRPTHYSIYEWNRKCYPAQETTFEGDIQRYGTTKDTVSGLAYCPVNILITDTEGRRLGVLDDGSMAFEIPNASIMNLPNDADNNNWYFELDSDVSSNYNLEIIGTDEGTFELLIANTRSKSIKYYGEQPIAQGEKAEIVLDSSNPEASLILQDGTEVQPTSIQPTSIEKSKRDDYNHIIVQQEPQKVLIGQNLQFDGFNTTPVIVSRIVSGDIVNVYHADADNSIHNVNWQTSGAFYVNYDPMAKTYDAQLSVEEPDMPLVLKVGTNEVSSIAEGTDLIIDTRGMNLFPEDQVDLVVIGPDGQIKHDEVNDQQFTDITVDYLTSNYGDADNTLETAGWGIGAYIFWVKTDSEYACGLDAVSNVKPLKILKGSITIEAETASTVERATVKLTVMGMGVAGDPIRVESSPLSDKVLFKEGIDDTPTGANYHVNWFTDTIDADGIRRYAVEFNDMGIYTIKVTVTGGDRGGDSDTVEITVLEKEVPLNLPAPIPSELEIAELFTSNSVYPKGEKVDVHYYITNIGTVDADEYHVEYDIIDAKGKTVYENVGGAHSISVGDENKWHSEMWEIPSNAEYGPYTVKARLKWNSRIGTKTTDFFVTIATKTEDPRAELDIAELYTSKSAYLKGENVKVCYNIINVGIVDVDEYHVMYEISGVDGEKICWFILSPHRIAAGEKQNWCPTENWNIPSNAESGTYTIEAAVIWGSKTVEKKTAFLVK